MGKQEVIPDGIKFCNIHHGPILLDLFANNNLNDDDNCASDADWKIGKKPERYLKKTEFDIDVNDNEIDGLNEKKHSSPQ